MQIGRGDQFQTDTNKDQMKAFKFLENLMEAPEDPPPYRIVKSVLIDMRDQVVEEKYLVQRYFVNGLYFPDKDFPTVEEATKYLNAIS